MTHKTKVTLSRTPLSSHSPLTGVLFLTLTLAILRGSVTPDAQNTAQDQRGWRASMADPGRGLPGFGPCSSRGWERSVPQRTPFPPEEVMLENLEAGCGCSMAWERRGCQIGTGLQAGLYTCLPRNQKGWLRERPRQTVGWNSHSGCWREARLEVGSQGAGWAVGRQHPRWEPEDYAGSLLVVGCL